MFAAAGLMLATPSCKKGENDPFMSLSSRKARFAGTWDMTAYEYSDGNEESDGDYQPTNATYSDGIIFTVYA